MICWYCYWGWPQEVVEIYNRWLDKIGESAMEYGPGHIVWSDENFEDESIQSCIDDKYVYDLSKEERDGAIESLRELLKVPSDIRNCEPPDYDGEHPENYPPPAGMVMVKNR